MPREFMPRFVISQLMLLVPAFVVLLTLCYILNPKVFPLMLGGKILVLAVLTPFFIWSAKRHRRMFEVLGGEAATAVGKDGIRSHALPLAGAIVILGTIHSITRNNWRWAVIIFAIGGLLAVGLFLRWFIYERWMRAYLLTLPKRPYDAMEVMSWIDPSWYRRPSRPS